MKSLLYGLAALPLLAGVALAGQPVQLSDTQMDKVTAGFDALFHEVSNTSVVGVSVYEPGTASSQVAAGAATLPTGGIANVYLDIESSTFSVASAFVDFPKP
jgi:hypothetical protein